MRFESVWRLPVGAEAEREYFLNLKTAMQQALVLLLS